jgi:cytochrome c oxidase cbb3-type subunit 2
MLVFFVLVWSDSAAFTEIQQSAELKAISWSGTVNLWAIGCVHLGVAVLGGWLMDRGRFAWLAVLTLLGLCCGFLLLKDGSLGGLDPTLLYVASVSLYSTALVAFTLVQVSVLPAVLRAGLVFAVAGWIGSAMGIGMVNDLGSLPVVFWFVAALVLSFGLWLARKRVVV